MASGGQHTVGAGQGRSKGVKRGDVCVCCSLWSAAGARRHVCRRWCGLVQRGTTMGAAVGFLPFGHARGERGGNGQRS
jgi:hypothetical protein